MCKLVRLDEGTYILIKDDVNGFENTKEEFDKLIFN
jgi:hypothetical protein